MQKENKREVLERLLAEGDTMICVDSRHPGVQVPAAHRGDPNLRLILNLGFRHRIQVLDEGVEAELLFRGEPYLCWIPFESLWAAYDPGTGAGVLWPEHVPLELRSLVEEAMKAQEKQGKKMDEGPPAEQEKGNGRKGRPALRVIPGGKKG